ncbi:hypothetical protein GNP63_09205 [Aliivibrio fischeri]|uniref:hypothetical protein n=1 Tax=Aliivibrio fischeri TaxID=668 RepID=UPI0012D9300F|nr:hypothetical protein [Aliivibrio fischeri]MUH96728.1 hypothetical protein [Aliivibrio fischeri]MUI63804.1 hypothetical protein [Aliivibrio fischeri]
MNLKYSIFIFLSVIFIYILSCFSYSELISVSYSYMGFENNFSSFKFILSTALVVLTGIYISIMNDEFNRFISLMLYLFVTVPNAVIFIFMDETELIFIWSMLTIPLTVFFMSILPVFKVHKIKDKNKKNILWVFILILIVPVVYAYGFKVNFNAFLLKDIYEIRLNARGENNVFSVYSYFILAKVVCPMALVYSLQQKDKILGIVSLSILAYLFMSTGHKSVYFSIFVVAIFSLGKCTIKNKVSMLILGSLFLLITSRLLTYFYDFDIFESLFVRRLFYIPALLNIYFFEYFDDKSLYYSGSFMSWILDYPLDRVPAREIGYVYFGSEDMSANNGFISDGFANLGHFGVLLTLFITSWCYKFYKSYNVSVRYIGLIFLMFYAFQGSSISTALITHGVLLLLIFISIFLSNSSVQEK